MALRRAVAFGVSPVERGAEWLSSSIRLALRQFCIVSRPDLTAHFRTARWSGTVPERCSVRRRKAAWPERVVDWVVVLSSKFRQLDNAESSTHSLGVPM